MNNTDKKLTTWLNEGKCGFYEYDCWYNGIHACARTLDDLQIVLRNVLKDMNEATKTAVKTDGFVEQYEQLPSEERSKYTLIGYFNHLNARELTDEELESIKDKLYDEEICIKDNPDIIIQHYEPTEEDIQELQSILDDNPEITQFELEKLYVDHETNNPHTKIYLLNAEAAKKEIEQYDANVSTATMMCDLYEQMNELNSQLVNTSEELVTLYEEKETNNESL